jgi:hypothetical protein
MSNALSLYESGEIKVACAISHYREITMGLCVITLEHMKAKFVGQRIVSGKTPMCASFNASLDYACDVGADIVFHTASDVIVAPKALTELLSVMDLDENYLSVGRGYDSMFGRKSAVGIWIWNMRILGRAFRFRNVFKQDLDLCERIETATGKTRTYTPRDLSLGYHHPIWTPEELFLKFRYSMPKYQEKRISDMREFLRSGLEANPTNKTLRAGMRGAEAAEQGGPTGGSKDNAAMMDEYHSATSDLMLQGTEYYVKHKYFKNYAQTRLRSNEDCITCDEAVPDPDIDFLPVQIGAELPGGVNVA